MSGAPGDGGAPAAAGGVPARAPASRRWWVLVLAGGDGTRLRPLTRAVAGRPIPKQYCPLVDGRSLLELTLDRARRLAPPERILVVVDRTHLPFAAGPLRAVPAGNVLVQPANRDTGPGILFALTQLARRDPSAVCAVFPSDHWIGDEDAFVARVAEALRVAASCSSLVLLGIEPERADSGLGYIEPAAPVRVGGVRDVRRVAGFREKPAPEDAARLVARGWLWNSFVMAFPVAAVVALVARLRPDDLQPMQALATRPHAAEAIYRDGVPAWNFSSGFLARVPEHLVVLRTTGTGWSDWGTPEAVARTFARLHRVPPWQKAARSAVA